MDDDVKGALDALAAEVAALAAAVERDAPFVSKSRRAAQSVQANVQRLRDELVDE